MPDPLETSAAARCDAIVGLGIEHAGFDERDARVMVYLAERLADVHKRATAIYGDVFFEWGNKGGPVGQSVRMVPRCDGGGHG